MTDALAMDIAARVAEQPDWVGSTYKIGKDWSANQSHPQSVELSHREGLRLLIDAIGQAKITLAEDLVQIQLPIDTQLHRRGQTYRWRYVVRPSA